MKSIVATTLLLCAAFLGTGDARADDAGWKVTLNGVGPVRLGMTVKQAEKALGTKLTIDDYLDDDSCRYFTTKSQPSIAFMTDHKKIVRIDIIPGAGAPPVTDKGAKIGDAEAHVLALYKGHIKVGPHHYTGPEGHYLRVLDGKRKVRLIFETDGKKVENFRIGREPAVEYVEGCL